MTVFSGAVVSALLNYKEERKCKDKNTKNAGEFEKNIFLFYRIGDFLIHLCV